MPMPPMPMPLMPMEGCMAPMPMPMPIPRPMEPMEPGGSMMWLWDMTRLLTWKMPGTLSP